MAFKKKPEEVKKGAPEYMNTYGDMVTLMLTFFVLLFAMSSIDVEKFIALAQSYSGQTIIIGGQGSIMPESGVGLLPDMVAQYEEQKTQDANDDSDKSEAAKAEDERKGEEARRQEEAMNTMASEFKTYFALNDVTQNIVVDSFGDHLRITFPDGMLFDPGRADLKPASLEVLRLVAEELRKYQDRVIRVEGHTDNVPMRNGLFPNNLYLSGGRAMAVVDYLITNMGFNPRTLRAEAMGEYWPVDTNDTPEGRARNRRVEIKIYENSELAFYGR